MIWPVVSDMRDIRVPLTATVVVVPFAPPDMRFIIAPIMPSKTTEDFSVVLTSARSAGVTSAAVSSTAQQDRARFMVASRAVNPAIVIGRSDAAIDPSLRNGQPTIFVFMRRELRAMVSLAWPVILAEIGWVLMGIVDTIFVGPLGPAAIGAVGIGSDAVLRGDGVRIGTVLRARHVRGAELRRRPDRRMSSLAVRGARAGRRAVGGARRRRLRRRDPAAVLRHSSRRARRAAAVPRARCSGRRRRCSSSRCSGATCRR